MSMQSTIPPPPQGLFVILLRFGVFGDGRDFGVVNALFVCD